MFKNVLNVKNYNFLLSKEEFSEKLFHIFFLYFYIAFFEKRHNQYFTHKKNNDKHFNYNY